MALREPIAVVGIGCRFPGAPDVDSFWRVLRDGIEAVREYSGQRFEPMDRVFSSESLRRGAIASLRGGFLPDLDLFDAGFFGISPREAALLDPQQRLLLEVAWEATEDAGIPTAKLSGTRTGVFVGLWNSDYEHCIYDSQDLDFYATTGGGRYPASGRLAYFFDLRGPNLTVDTACSSSLVAIHLACASLRSGESEMAMAGGVNVIMRPEITLSYSAAKMLSPDGQCKFGDASANGYVRSEGAGIVFLKTLSRATADHDPIYAVIRGSSVNNDGKSSGLLISPSREGQADMLRTALRDAGVAPKDVDYVEAHGTGTMAGDPVEIDAITAVMNETGRKQPCMVGSVKTNLGHTESAAGAAGLIKVALSLSHRAIPASLHFRQPNPKIDWKPDVVAIPTTTVTWPERETLPIAGVSSFGITGTNAHVILEGVTDRVADPETSGRPELFLLSAHTPAALAAQASSWRDRLIADAAWGASFRDLAYTASVRRTHQDFRLALVSCTRQELLDRLNSWLNQQEQTGVRSGKRLPNEKRRAVFVFPGQGGQWIGMGRSLLRDEPVFSAAMRECDEAIRKHTGWKVTTRLLAEEPSATLTGIEVIQPVLFAVMVSLAALWRSYGVEPEAVVGHSMGEAAAAAVCGALCLDDAAAVICHRSRLMSRAAGRGLMAVAELSLDDCEKFARDYAGRISVAANNGPTSTVLSGDTEAIEDALLKLEAREIFCRRIKVDVASHCGHMDPLRSELAKLLKNIRPRRASIPFYSTTSGLIEDGTGLDSIYWSRNLRQPVLFFSAVQSLLADGFDTFVEVNAHPVLQQAIQDGIRHADKEAVTVPSLRRDKPEREEMLDALGTMHIGGFPIDLTRLYPQGRCLRLPPYSWQRERHWIEVDNLLQARGHAASAHPKLGAHVVSSVEPAMHLWEADLRAEPTRYAAHLLDLTVSAASEALASDSLDFADLEFLPSSDKDCAGQIALTPCGGSTWSLQISAKTESGWSPRCRGKVRQLDNVPSALPLSEKAVELTTAVNSGLLFECLQHASAAICDQYGSGAYRTARIKQIVWHGAGVQGKRFVSAKTEETSDATEASCRLQLEDGTVLLEIQSIEFQLATEWDPAELVYDLDWKPILLTSEHSTANGVWVVVGDSKEVVSRITARLREQGDECICAFDAEAVRPALESAGPSCRGVLCVPGSKAGAPADALKESLFVIQVVRALAAGSAARPPRLWILSSGACSIPGDSGEQALAQGTLWGLGRVIAREHPELHGTNLDLPFTSSDDDYKTLARLLRQGCSQELIAIRGAVCLAARFKRCVGLETVKPIKLQADATYLVTGGMGGIGVELLEWLVSLGARHIALIGRRPPARPILERLEAMRASGVEVMILNADVADRDQMTVSFDRITASLPQLRGVFHLAAVTDDVLLSDLNETQLERVMHPKVNGAWILHHLTQHAPLDFFVLFSSVAAVLSQPGQGSYAAANSYLDCLAQYRRNRGLKASSIQWGPWTGVGLATAEGTVRSIRAYREQGISSPPLKTQFAALELILSRGVTNSLVLAVRWDAFARSFTDDKIPSHFADLAGASRLPLEAPALQESLSATLLSVPAGRARRALLEDHLQHVLAGVLKADASRMDPTKPLGSLGLDSLMALQLVRRLATSTSVHLPATAVFNYPTLRLLGTELSRRMEIPLDAETLAAPRSPVAEPRLAAASRFEELTEEETISALLSNGGTT